MDQRQPSREGKIGSHDRRWYFYPNSGLNDIPCLREAGIGISIKAKSELMWSSYKKTSTKS
jgi:hypothetical protein